MSSFNNINLDSIPVLATAVEPGDGDPLKETPLKTPVAKTSHRVTKPSAALQAKTDEHLTRLRERSERALVSKRNEVEARVLQAELPFWNDDNRGVPNPFIRSGIFSVGRVTDERRQFVKKLEVPSLSNYSITYTGSELHQDDLDVWMSLINRARAQHIADSVLFTGYELIRDLGWTKNSRSYARAKASIERLKVTGLEISQKDPKGGTRAYSGSLIREYLFEASDGEGNTKWMVRFEPNVTLLFMNDTTTLLEWQVRKKLGSKASLAKWLHAFYSSHIDPIPYAVSKLKELSRSQDSLSSFRATLKTGLQRIKDIGFLKDFHVAGDVVHVKVAAEYRAALLKATETPRIRQ